MTHQEDQRFSMRLEDTDQAVLTVWEINFRQLEQKSIEATHLLLLFSFMEPSSIQEVILHRGTSAQKRWGKKGEVIEITPEDEGVDEFLVKIIQDDLEFYRAIERLLSLSLISCNQESNGLRNFSIHPLVQYCAMRRLPPSEVDKWRLKALLLVCHAFPRNRYIEPVNGEVGRLLLPHLGRVLGHYDAICVKHGEQPIFVHELASTLLAASRFSNAKWKTEAISRAKKLLEDDKDPYMNAWLAYRESAIARMFGKEAESEDALQRFLQFSTTLGQEEFELDPRFNAQRGDLIISFSENLIRQGKLLEAKKELIEWKPLGGSQSTLEGITLRARDITLGKVLRYQGLFEEARTLLEGVLQNSVLDDYFEGTGWYRVLLSNVADLYCELGLPANSEKLIMQELSPMKERGTQDIATGRRLQMSLAETYLQRHMYAKAESLLLDLQRAFMSSDGPEYTSDVNTFRIWILLARISHAQSCWDECLARWKHALSVLERLNLDRGFNSGLVRCSIADVLFMTGHRTEAAEMFRKARADMTSEPRIFWIPLFNSQWHDFIMDRSKEIEY